MHGRWLGCSTIVNYYSQAVKDSKSHISYFLVVTLKVHRKIVAIPILGGMLHIQAAVIELKYVIKFMLL